VSPIGVVPKKNGKKRMIMDLRFVNTFIATPQFKLETITTATKQLKPMDQMIKIDLKDGYFHIPIHKSHQTFLGFQWNGMFFKYKALPFGLSIAPFWFTKFLRPIVQFLRTRGFRMVSYVDDFLFLLRGKNIEIKIKEILKTFRRFGLSINLEKSSLSPSTQMEFLGLILDSQSMTIQAPKKKIKDLKNMAKLLLKRLNSQLPVSKRTLARFTGSAIALTQAILPTRTMLFQFHKIMKKIPSWDSSTILPTSLQSDLNWWIKYMKDWNGKMILDKSNLQLILTTDASESGWGATFLNKRAAGFWSLKWKKKSSNQRELQAVLMALKTFASELKDSSVKVRSDNSTAVAQINLCSGRSRGLNRILRKILNLSRSLNINLTAEYLPGVRNTLADSLSRITDRSDWMLNRSIFQILDKRWGPHTVDRFATSRNNQVPRFNALRYCPGVEAIDAMTQCWRADNNWANPPFSMLQDVINLIQKQRATTTLIAPIWKSQPWFKQLLKLRPKIVLLPNSRLTFLPGFLGNAEPLKNPQWQVAAFRIFGSGKRLNKAGTKTQPICCPFHAHPTRKEPITQYWLNAKDSANNRKSPFPLSVLPTLPNS
jgi:hypothetical protein